MGGASGIAVIFLGHLQTFDERRRDAAQLGILGEQASRRSLRLFGVLTPGRLASAGIAGDETHRFSVKQCGFVQLCAIDGGRRRKILKLNRELFERGLQLIARKGMIGPRRAAGIES